MTTKELVQSMIEAHESLRSEGFLMLSSDDKKQLLHYWKLFDHIKPLDARENVIKKTIYILAEYRSKGGDAFLQELADINKKTPNAKNPREQTRTAVKSAQRVIEYIGKYFTCSEHSAKLREMLDEFIKDPEHYRSDLEIKKIPKTKLQRYLYKIHAEKHIVDDFLSNIKNS